ncbi:MAG: hypothetical protein RBS88_03615 [Spongiibacteraceae bacterium]|nr:hypothetical protein [Spongiibacteraceae bacterium]
MANEVNAQAARGRRELYIIVGMLVLVMVGATALYKAAEHGVLDLPSLFGTNNNGVLISPPQRIDALDLRYADGSPFDFERDDSRWTLLVPVPPSCNEQCQNNLYITRQARTALGRDMNRVSRLIVTAGAPETSLAELINREHNGVPVLRVSETAFDRVFGDLQRPIQPLADNLILLVDPRGWMMMYYTPEHDGYDILDDMKLLLKYSPKQAEGTGS